MFNSYAEFRAAALACGDEYYADGSLCEEKMDAAHKIFKGASAGTKLMDFDGNPVQFGLTVVGRLALKEADGTWIAADESFPSIDEIMQENMLLMSEEDAASGSILSAELWSLLANDAWLLGGIRARTEFHFASPLRWSNLWDETRDRMTVTAREVIGITAFGFEISRPVPALEAIAQCRDEGLAGQASLQKYKEEVEKYQTAEQFRAFYESLPEQARR